jgi:small subunit ribosomal protein S11
MGKKKVIKQTKEEAIKESEKVEATAVKKAGQSSKIRAEKGRIYVNASYNNTIITVTDESGAVIAWMSARRFVRTVKKSTCNVGIKCHKKHHSQHKK